MKKQLQLILLFFLALIGGSASAQVTLPSTGTSYTENFDGIGAGLSGAPGFSIYTGATSSSLGIVPTLPFYNTINTVNGATTTNWNGTSAGFKNFASATGQATDGSTSIADQGIATNRALGVRQTSATGYDPGVSFVFQVANTTGKKNFKLSFKLQSLDVSSVVTRTTTWVVDYSLPAAATTFVPATTTGTMVTGNLVFSNNTVTVDFGSLFDNLSGVVTIRVSALAGSSGGGSRASTGIDDWALTWDPLVASTPTLTATTTPATAPTSIDFGTTQTLGTSSAPKAFTLSGTNLTAATTLTATGPYTLSKTSGGTYGTSLSYTPAELATAQQVYVIFTPTGPTAVSGIGSIAIASGVATASVALTGTGAPAVPRVTASLTTLPFGSVALGTSGNNQFTLSGANLTTGSVTVTTSGAYTISKLSASGFASSIVFTSAEIALTPTVYVMFTPTATGAANSSITFADPEVTSIAPVTVTGTGIAPVLSAATTPATSPTSIDYGSQTINTSATKSFVLSGTNISGTTTVTSTGSTAYTVSKTNGSGYAASITFTTTEMAANPVVYVQFLPTALGTIAGNVQATTTGTGANTINVGLTGICVAAPVPTLALAPTTLTFSSLVGSTIAAQSFTITGANITGASTVTVAAPYSVSKTSTGTYSTSLSYLATDFPSGSGAQTVFVKFSPTAVGTAAPNSAVATVATTGGSNQTVALNGTGIGVPLLTPSVTTLPLSAVNGLKTVQSFTLTGAYITATTTLTATGTPYLLSKDNVTFASTLTYSVADLATAQTVYVQFTAPATLGAAPGSIAISSTGANTATVTLNGISLGTPVLSVTPPALTFALPSSTTAVTSAAQTFALNGVNITANTTVTASSSAYLLSKDGVTYSSSLTYSAADMATAQTVYVTFSITSSSTIGSTTSSIVVASAGATNATLALTGNVINTAPTLAAISDVSLCYTPAQQTIALTGITPGVETTQGTIVSVTSTNPALFSSIGTIPGASSSVASLIYTLANGASGTAAVTVTVKDNGGTANGGVDTYTRTFNITVNPLAVVTITSDAPNNLLEKGSIAILTASGGLTYTWTANTTIFSSLTGASITVRPSAATTYTVTATNATGCTTVQTITINIRAANKLETSNVLTPNGDGKNDYWVVRNIDLYPGNSVKVFDKSGKLVYSKTGYNNDWNGYYNGAPLAQGTYYYVVDLGTVTPYRGTISVVRD